MMYGRRVATNGMSMPFLDSRLKACRYSELAVCVLISVAVHVLVLVFPFEVCDGCVLVGKDDWRFGGNRLQVSFRQMRSAIQIEPAPSSDLAINPLSGRKDKGKEGAPAVLQESAPDLISDIDTEIADERAYGFMILRIDVSSTGEATGTEVLYSGLSDGVTATLAARFSRARFKPAMHNGEKVNATMFLRIDVQ